MVICGKWKIGYLDGTICKLSGDDPSYSWWDIQNSMVMTWLMHSIKEKINDTNLFYSIVEGIRDAVRQAYVGLEKFSQMLKLKC